MTKDVMIRIVGKQIFEKEEDVSAEFFTEGKIFKEDGQIFMEYDETELSGFLGGHTVLTIGKEKLIMTRSDCADGSGDTRMEFIKGRRFEGIYETPIGSQGIEILANDLKINIDREELIGQIDVDYNFSLKGLVEGRSLLSIEIMDKNSDKSCIS